MLKIKKGIKKKIKGKKEKEEDLFDPENLAKYKKELEESRREAAAAAAGVGSTSSATPSSNTAESAPNEEDEEWKRFKLLTAKVDVTLKNTSAELDKIKTTSYYQKKASTATVEEKKEKWEDLEKEEHFDFHEESSFPPESNSSDFTDKTHHQGHSSSTSWGGELKQEQKTVSKPEEVVLFPEPEEEIVELDDGLFDTSYLDAIESGEIQLAYIPDSPTEEVKDGEDPFDTSCAAEVVKKIHEEEIKEKKKVNLGFAVNFLTKKSDVPPAHPVPVVPYSDKTAELKKTKRGRPVHVDLLGFDGEDETTATENQKEKVKVEEKTPDPSGVDLKDLIREFEISDIPSIPSKLKVVSNLDLLVAEEEKEEEVVDEDDVWFRTEDETDNKKEEEDSIDPFDTSVVEKIGFGKAELKILEEELLPEEESQHQHLPPPSRPPLPTTPTTAQTIVESPPEVKQYKLIPQKPPPRPPSPPHPLDELGPELHFDAAALTPQTTDFQEPEIDPFDTSNVSHIALPGKSELRILEDELVTPSSLVQEFVPSFSSDAFSTEVILNPLEAPDECINPVLEIQPQPLPKAVPVEEISKEFEDPFDTSEVVEAFAPGKQELKELESELLNSTEDFVPVRVCPLKNFKVLHSSSITSTVAPIQTRQESFHPLDSVDGDCQVEHRPLSPHVATAEDPFIDPFDTSGVTGILPGKIEAKILEEELAAVSFEPNFSHTRFERTPNTFSLPPAPVVTFPISNFEEEEIDPFDTSIAESLVK